MISETDLDHALVALLSEFSPLQPSRFTGGTQFQAQVFEEEGRVSLIASVRSPLPGGDQGHLRGVHAWFREGDRVVQFEKFECRDRGNFPRCLWANHGATDRIRSLALPSTGTTDDLFEVAIRGIKECADLQPGRSAAVGPSWGARFLRTGILAMGAFVCFKIGSIVSEQKSEALS
ncbi:MAG: hypothetical protein HYT76_03180 [Deltaproteobacteria bacterium]|nr:hypothetical protein [Deltaproteobacteria bacterium]